MSAGIVDTPRFGPLLLSPEDEYLRANANMDPREGYWRTNIGGSRKAYVHRLITNAPSGLDVDHINRNRSDNRRENLRTCTRSQNLRNGGKRPTFSDKSSRFKGVHWSRVGKKWRAAASVNRQSHYLGLFADEVEAAKAYDAFVSKHFGQFARTNF